MKKIISFDFWDTLVKRKCHPEEVKLNTARYIWLKHSTYLKEEYCDIYKILALRNQIEADICNHNREIGNDPEVLIDDVFTELVKRIFTDPVDICEELLKVELDFEKSVLYINPDILAILEEYKDLDRYIISDFYMRASYLQEMLDYLEFPYSFIKIYSSCEYMKNKREGQLYQYFIEDVNASFEDQIHVGDNPYSDIESAKKFGIETIKIANESIYKFENKACRPISIDFSKLKKEGKTIQEKLYNFGLMNSCLLYYFVYSISEYATQLNYDQVYYMTREGETFIRAHQFLEENSPFGFDAPKSSILEVSRVATFSASLDALNPNELLRLWSQYQNQSMSALFKSLGIPTKQYESLFEHYKIDKDEVITSPRYNMKWKALFKNKEFIKMSNIDLAQKRNELVEYLKINNVLNKDRILTVDIGWRGTIQDNLSYVLSNSWIDGYYYALFDFYNLQPKNSNKEAFIKDDEFLIKSFASLITLFEMLFNPNSGSVISYKAGKAERNARTDELEFVNNYTSHIQDGMVAGSKVLNDYFKYHPYMASELEKFIEQTIDSIRSKPPKELLEIYNKLVHNDTFGTGKYVEGSDKLSLVKRWNLFSLRHTLQGVGWKEAYIEKHNLHTQYKAIMFLSKLKNVFRGKGRKNGNEVSS